MPSTPEIDRQLAAEALENHRRGAPMPRPADASNPADRLKMAANMLGTAIDAQERSLAHLRAVTTFFVAEFSAAVGAVVDPATLLSRNAAVEKIQQGTRPKTFTAGQQPTTGDSNGDG